MPRRATERRLVFSEDTNFSANCRLTLDHRDDAARFSPDAMSQQPNRIVRLDDADNLVDYILSLKLAR